MNALTRQGLHKLTNRMGCVMTCDRIIDAGWSSALIIEDDVDWDLNIKSQMQHLANSSRTLGNGGLDPSEWMTSTTPTDNPYGNGWDMLWLGPCINPPAPPDSQLFPGEDGSQAHWVYYAREALGCSWGYAVTRQSAIALFAWLQDLDGSVDYAMSRWCGRNRCIVVWPELIGCHRPAGGPRRGSDNTPLQEDEDREKGWTRNIMHSTIVEVLDKFGTKETWDN